ncbi:unnamed protein product [Trichobilharzia regenti]|nr:unnamed protein product [Trichobilharzia regenti]
MLSARGRILLFADADGATQFSDIEKLEEALSSSIANRWVSCFQITLFISIILNISPNGYMKYRVIFFDLSTLHLSDSSGT